MVATIMNSSERSQPSFICDPPAKIVLILSTLNFSIQKLNNIFSSPSAFDTVYIRSGRQAVPTASARRMQYPCVVFNLNHHTRSSESAAAVNRSFLGREKREPIAEGPKSDVDLTSCRVVEGGQTELAGQSCVKSKAVAKLDDD